MKANLEDKLKISDIFFFCPGTLKNIPDNDFNLNVYSNVQSKITELGYQISDEPSQDKYHAVGLVIEEDNTKVQFFGKLFSFSPRGAVANVGDMFVFIDSLGWSIEKGKATPYFFKISEKTILGSGSKTYRAQIIFSDKYYIDVHANTEEEAIETAYSIPMNSWTHEWPHDDELNNFQGIRQSVWGKKMIGASELNE